MRTHKHVLFLSAEAREKIKEKREKRKKNSPLA
jgi:hypothetical protein